MSAYNVNIAGIRGRPSRSPDTIKELRRDTKETPIGQTMASLVATERRLLNLRTGPHCHL